MSSLAGTRRYINILYSYYVVTGAMEVDLVARFRPDTVRGELDVRPDCENTATILWRTYFIDLEYWKDNQVVSNINLHAKVTMSILGFEHHLSGCEFNTVATMMAGLVRRRRNISDKREL